MVEWALVHWFEVSVVALLARIAWCAGILSRNVGHTSLPKIQYLWRQEAAIKGIAESLADIASEVVPERRESQQRAREYLREFQDRQSKKEKAL